LNVANRNLNLGIKPIGKAHWPIWKRKDNPSLKDESFRLSHDGQDNTLLFIYIAVGPPKGRLGPILKGSIRKGRLRTPMVSNIKAILKIVKRKIVLSPPPKAFQLFLDPV
jgi:hypothetical protein